jgi:hypothetical protein
MTDNTTEANIDTALSIAGMISTALPEPYGAVGEVTFKVLEDFLPYFFGEPENDAPPPPTLAQIGQLVAVQSATDTEQRALATFNGLLQAYQSRTNNVDIPFPATLSPEVLNDSSNSFADFYTILHGSLTGTSGQFTLITDIESLTTTPSTSNESFYSANTNLAASYMNTYAVGVSLYVTLWQFLVSLVYAVENKIPTTFVGNIQQAVNQLTTTPVQGQAGWIGYAQAMTDALNDAVAARIAQVTPATPFTFGGFDALFGGKAILAAVYFDDTGPAVDDFDPSTLTLTPYVGKQLAPWPGDDLNMVQRSAVYAVGSSNDQWTTDAVAALRQAYVDTMTQKIYSHYFDGPTMVQTIAKWQEGVRNLQKAIASCGS